MAGLNAFIARTITWYLVVGGAMTATTILFAVDVDLFTPLFGVDYTPSSVPVLRHWGFMVFGIGVLMIAAAFRPWLRFETMVFCTLEKWFLVYLVLGNLGEPWIRGYLGASILDGTLATYGILYFLSDQGRPWRWVRDDDFSSQSAKSRNR